MRYIVESGARTDIQPRRTVPSLQEERWKIMKKNKVVFTVLAAGGLLFSAACKKDYTGKEDSHPIFAQGVTLKSSQNYSKARDAFEGFLVYCPKSARAHRELAELYSDYLGDYVRAVYHYERYLEYAKISDIDRKDIRKHIEGCKKKFYERYQQENGLAPLPQESQTEAASQDLRAMENSLVAARQWQSVMAEKYRTLLAEKKRLEAELKVAAARSAAAEKKNASSSASRNVPPVRVQKQMPSAASGSGTAGEQTYRVQPGETLSMIARKFFGKSSAWKTIRDANPGVIGPDGIVRAGQEIRIPAAGK